MATIWTLLCEKIHSKANMRFEQCELAKSSGGRPKSVLVPNCLFMFPQSALVEGYILVVAFRFARRKETVKVDYQSKNGVSMS